MSRHPILAWGLAWGLAGLAGALWLLARGAGPVPWPWLLVGLPAIAAAGGVLAGAVDAALTRATRVRLGVGLPARALLGALAGALAGWVVLAPLGGLAHAPAWGAVAGLVSACSWPQPSRPR